MRMQTGGRTEVGARAEIILEGGPMHGQRVPRAEGEYPLTYPCHIDTKPMRRAIVFDVLNGPRVERAIYADSGRVVVEFCHDTPVYAYREAT